MDETYLEVMDSGTIINTTLFGVDDYIYDGGTAIGTILNNGAIEYISRTGGSALKTTVNAQGVEVVSGGLGELVVRW